MNQFFLVDAEILPHTKETSTISKKFFGKLNDKNLPEIFPNQQSFLYSLHFYLR
jgi:hypothetical protein